jgi:N-acetylneuraminate synthase
MQENEMQINDLKIGYKHEPVVIAEIGINHNGSLDDAKDIASLAIDSGAHIIKHQTHVVEDEMSNEAKDVIPGNADISIYEIMEQCALSEEDEYELMKFVEQKGAIFISTPFSRAAADRLQRFDVPAYKIGSGECNNYPLVKHIASFKKPVIMSTGMNDISSISKSVDILREAGTPFALLHTTNIYPTPYELVRINAVTTIAQAFPDAIVGLSDHTTSNDTCIASVALGASILERHFTDSMEREGPDIKCSMDPFALRQLVESSRNIFNARGDGKTAVESENPTIAFAFASVVAIKDIDVGEKLTEENIWVKRPGGGDFSAEDYDDVLGRTASVKIQSGFQLRQSQLID